jgi:membrane protein implicated in regulation of membrane protease activity
MFRHSKGESLSPTGTRRAHIPPGQVSDGWGKLEWLKDALEWAGGHLDPLAALLAGAAAALAGLFGWLEGDALTTATLGVLVVVALSLVRERTLRLTASKRIDEVLDESLRTREDVKLLDSGHPYQVVVSESTWDIEENGDSHVVRWKKLRFAQNDVIAVVDWSTGDGTLVDTKYTPGKRVHTFNVDGRQSALVALDRTYARDEEQDLLIERTRKGVFMKTPDRIWVHCLDPTSVMRATVRWPLGRPPSQVRLIRRSDRDSGRPVVVQPIKSADDRLEFTAEVPEPTRGERLCIEWDWNPPTQ